MRSVTRPISAMVSTMGRLAAGDHRVEIQPFNARIEIGEMGRALLVFREAADREGAARGRGGEARGGKRAPRRRRRRQAIAGSVRIETFGRELGRLAHSDLLIQFIKSPSPRRPKLRKDFNLARNDPAGAQECRDDLARRTEQQAASLEETAAALDEITATVKKSAEGATHARQVVAAADDDAKKSALVVRQAVEAMDAIAKSAQQISQIIGVIDEIAFQTNLLALNAGVEAARAGDAGRGFAVVASEVRALAQRSAEAAKEIKGLISASTTQVDHGVKLVAETGKSLERIMAQVAEINNVVSEIAAGAQGAGDGARARSTPRSTRWTSRPTRYEVCRPRAQTPIERRETCCRRGSKWPRSRRSRDIGRKSREHPQPGPVIRRARSSRTGCPRELHNIQFGGKSSAAIFGERSD